MVYLIAQPEQWKQIIIDNAKPYYMISTYGSVYSLYYNKFIIPHENENGYLQVSLITNDNKRIFRKVHRLVMMTFNYIDGCDMLQVNHINANKHDNYIHNLEWVTAKENIAHAISLNLRSSVGENNPKATISEKEAQTISEMIIQGYDDIFISNYIGCSKGIVREIALGRTWTYLFDQNTLDAMKRTRTGYIISDYEKHQICKFYQDNINKYTMYKKAKYITEDALRACNININDTTIRIARRLFYRLQNPDITNQYIY